MRLVVAVIAVVAVLAGYGVLTHTPRSRGPHVDASPVFAKRPTGPCWKRLAEDAYDGSIDGEYSHACAVAAAAHLPVDGAPTDRSAVYWKIKALPAQP